MTPRFRLANSAASVAATLCRVVGVVANAAPLPTADDEWWCITPWGDHPHAMGTQRVTPAAGRAMVTAFNSWSGKLATAFRGAPIYAGHPDDDPETYTDHRRYGSIRELEARNDGLFGRGSLNKLGKENQEEGYFVYPSPYWEVRQVARGVIEPTSLLSIGLTNWPNIKGSKPWTKNDAAGDPPPFAPSPRAGALRAARTARAEIDPISALFGR